MPDDESAAVVKRLKFLKQALRLMIPLVWVTQMTAEPAMQLDSIHFIAGSSPV
jgi:hypothetical protein